MEQVAWVAKVASDTSVEILVVNLLVIWCVFCFYRIEWHAILCSSWRNDRIGMVIRILKRIFDLWKNFAPFPVLSSIARLKKHTMDHHGNASDIWRVEVNNEYFLFIYIFITLVLRLDSRGLYNDVYNIYIYIYISIVIGDDIQIGIIAVIWPRARRQAAEHLESTRWTLRR